MSIEVSNFSAGLAYTQLRGTGTISNTTTGYVIKKNDNPAAAEYFVYERATKKIVATGISNASGEWEVTNLDTNRYYAVVTYNDDSDLNSSTLDWIQPQ